MMANKPLNKILLVEDEADIQVIAKYALEKIGKFTVKYCFSGNEALEQAESFMPDLILMDVMMPKMDGITTLKKLREIPALQDTPVIFMTAKAQASEVNDYKKLKILDVILKPFDTLSLSENLHKIWDRYHDKNA